MKRKRNRITVRLEEEEMAFLRSRTVSFSQTVRSALHAYLRIIHYLQTPYAYNRREWNRTKRIIEQVKSGEPLISVRRKSLNKGGSLK